MLKYRLDILPASTWILMQDVPQRILPFALTEIGHFYAGRQFYTERSDKDGYFLVYTEEGCGQIQYEGTTLTLNPGQAMLLECTPQHRYETAGTQWVHRWMHLDGNGMAGFAAHLPWHPVTLAYRPEFEQRFAQLEAQATSSDEAGLALQSHGISALLTAMLLSYLETDEYRDLARHPGIDAALRLIQQRLSSNVTIEDMARVANLSKYHFVRLFHRHLGCTPYQYLIRSRIGQAKQLLRTTNLAVAQIAEQVGYASESNFIRQFKEMEGATPSQFRKGNILFSAPATG